MDQGNLSQELDVLEMKRLDVWTQLVRLLGVRDSVVNELRRYDMILLAEVEEVERLEMANNG